jgi:hypothetical protein
VDHLDHLDTQLPEPFRWEVTDQLSPDEEREYSEYLDRLHSIAVNEEIVHGIDPFF